MANRDKVSGNGREDFFLSAGERSSATQSWCWTFDHTHFWTYIRPLKLLEQPSPVGRQTRTDGSPLGEAPAPLFLELAHTFN